MIRFNCFACNLDFEAKHFNLARITIPCPICETRLNITQSIGRAYGKTVGDQVAKIMDALEKVAERSKESLTSVIESAYGRIVNLCGDAE